MLLKIARWSFRDDSSPLPELRVERGRFHDCELKINVVRLSLANDQRPLQGHEVPVRKKACIWDAVAGDRTMVEIGANANIKSENCSD
jgi:hypothetical protein